MVSRLTELGVMDTELRDGGKLNESITDVPFFSQPEANNATAMTAAKQRQEQEMLLYARGKPGSYGKRV